MSSSNKSMYKNVLIVFVFTFIAKGIVFVREMQMANIFGATDITDAYNMATQITTMITEVFATAITSCFIPILGKIVSSVEIGDDLERKKYFNNLASLMIISIFLISLFCFVGTELFRDRLVSLLAPGFSGEKRILAAELSQISLIALLFLPLICILNGVLSIHEQFSKVSWATLILNIPPVIYLFIGKEITGFIYCIILGYAVEAVFLLICAIQSGYRFKVYLNYRDKHFVEFLSMLGPVLLGLGAKEINTLVDRIMASTLNSGELSLYNYASKLENMTHLILSTCFINVLFVVISKLKKDSSEFRDTVTDTGLKMLVLIVPVSGIMIALSDCIINIIYERGMFTFEDTKVCAEVLMILSAGVIIYAFRDLLNRIFYSTNDTKTPTIASIWTIVLNIIGNLVLVRLLGMNGLAIASVGSACFTCGYLVKKIRTEVNGIFGSSFVLELSKVFISGIIMAGTLFGIKLFLNYFQYSFIIRLLLLVVLCGVGIVEYFVLLNVLKSSTAKDTMKWIIGKVRR